MLCSSRIVSGHPSHPRWTRCVASFVTGYRTYARAILLVYLVSIRCRFVFNRLFTGDQ
ncbi:uncharacterized protein SCHCODRAFT_02086909 [Schizophyllum commune H4-8]|uniref:uncharacterized protein n=1 Tax=Schizophyllum commune (strain H4-8 / FGSC 9210) TaxID=578458 RepID=UPI00215E767A|nr:uncharacterized protein SCHCODRAFT_02086909 [Schizophyllum commune H4-8]KAI5887024.1 hypothetical protein SCHCODRAFT_02086909 [Schizophyllum commune H4-8]